MKGKVCDMDCLHCKYEDCINDRVYYDSALYKNRSEKAKEHACQYQKELREQARKKGLCIVCRKAPANHGVTCEECFRRNSKRQKQRYEKKRCAKDYSNKCSRCEAPRIEGKKLCEKHYAIAMKNLEKARESEKRIAFMERMKEAEHRRVERWRKTHSNVNSAEKK